MLKEIAAFLISSGASVFIIGSVIIVSKLKRLFDDPIEDRKIHLFKTPNLGGVGIYCAFIFTSSLMLNGETVYYFNSLIASSILIFSVGLKDDLILVSPAKKLFAQLIAAFIMAYFGDIRITSFYGILGIETLSYPVSLIITILISIYIYNALNLIDGIDGLAASIGIISCIIYAYLFYILDSRADVIIALSFCGSLLGFLYYNFPPAKIFMGDSGSLMLGFILSIFTFRFSELNLIQKNVFTSAPTLSISIILVPLFDTCRVFTLRVIKGKSPFSADRNHIHHRLLDIGFSHLQTSSILIITTITTFGIALYFEKMGNLQLFILLVFFSLVSNIILWNININKNENSTIKKKTEDK